MEVQSWVDHHNAGATLQQPEPYEANMLSHWANAYGGLTVWPRVGGATPPHPYNPLGILVGPFSHRQETFYFSSKNWGQLDIFP
jgi:hypothetical protein